MSAPEVRETLDPEALDLVLDRAIEMLVSLDAAATGPEQKALEEIMRRAITSFIGFLAVPDFWQSAADAEQTGKRLMALRLKTERWTDA